MAEYTGYISIKQILDDLLAHPLLKDLTLERAVDHAIHFLRIVGMPKLFSEKVETIRIEDYRAALPDDFYIIIEVISIITINYRIHLKGTLKPKEKILYSLAKDTKIMNNRSVL